MACNSCAYMRSVPIRRIKHPMEHFDIWTVLGTVVCTSLAVAISLPLLIFLLIVLPISAAVRSLLLFIYNKTHPHHSALGPEVMRSAEARWIGNAWKRSVFHSVLILNAKGGLTLDHFRRILTTRILPVYPRLTRLPVSLPLSGGGNQCWLPDTQFSIARHVLQGPSQLENRQQVQTYVAQLIEKELPYDKPPWEFHIITPHKDQKDTIVIVRVHQSIADGSTLMRVLCHSLADTSIIDAPERAQFGRLAFGLNVFRSCLTGPCTLLIWLWLSSGDLNPLTRRCTWTGAVTVTWSASITLPKVMRIKQVTRSTVNCVILSALAGALRMLLQGFGVRQPPNVKVMVPLDIRSQKQCKANSTALGNKSSSVVVPLPVSVEGCVPRLWAMRTALNSLRSSVDPVLLYLATAALMAVTPAPTARYLLDLLSEKASLQFSSLPGPSSHITVGGEQLKEIYCLMPATAHMGISVTAITYADQVYISVAAERALGPAAQLLMVHLEEQVETLWKLLLHRRVPGEGRVSCYTFTRDMVDSPVQEIEERLSVVQKQVVELGEKPDEEHEEKLEQLKSEFADLVGELKRRQSIGEREREPLNSTKIKTRSLSCSMSTRHSAISLKNILSSRTSSHFLEVEKGQPTDIPQSNKINTISHIENEVKNRNSFEATHSGVFEVHNYSHDNLNLHRKHRKNSFEIIRDQNKRKDLGGNVKNVSIEGSGGNVRGVTIVSNAELAEKLKDCESDETVDTETDYSDNTVLISEDEAMELGYDDLKTTGPINTNLRDLYCSNYLEYKLELLRRKESMLSQQITEQNHKYYADIEDVDGEEGILI